MDENIQGILRRFSIAAESVRQIHKRAWDIGDKYILKENRSPEELDKSYALSQLLREQGLPAAEFLKTAEGTYRVSDGDTFYCLMKKITGYHLDPYTATPYETGILLGEIVARLHLALKQFDGEFEFYNADLLQELSGWITAEIKAKSIPVKQEILEYCLSFAPLYRSLPRQLIHRDVHLGNMLFNEGGFAGYLDFDICQKNTRLFDIAYLGLSMLLSSYTDELRVRQWRKIFRGVLHGYGRVSSLTDEELAGIPYMFVSIELLFVAFFSSIGEKDSSVSSARMMEWLFENRQQLVSESEAYENTVHLGS